MTNAPAQVHIRRPRHSQGQTAGFLQLLHIFIQFFGRCVSSQRAHSCAFGGGNELSNMKTARNTYSARSARGIGRATSRAQADTRICRAGTPPSAPQPQFGSRRTDRSNSVWLTADKRGTINTRASGEEAGMGIKIITAAVRGALHPRV